MWLLVTLLIALWTDQRLFLHSSFLMQLECHLGIESNLGECVSEEAESPWMEFDKDPGSFQLPNYQIWAPFSRPY